MTPCGITFCKRIGVDNTRVSQEQNNYIRSMDLENVGLDVSITDHHNLVSMTVIISVKES